MFFAALTHPVALVVFCLSLILPGAPAAPHGGLDGPLRMATTTSTENSGLLAVLIPPFEKKFGIDVDVVAVGTGKALKLGRNGDVDIVFVHARKAEDAFVDAGYGVNRRDVMYNDFIIIGPPSDPGGIKGSTDTAKALAKLAKSGATFVSRGDDSGTHKKELSLWEAAGVKPKGGAYLETGQGMGQTLHIADEKGGYCLVDRGTFLAYSGKIDLEILVEGDTRLYNPYGIIAVNPAMHGHAKYLTAMAFIGWVTSVEGQKIIDTFRRSGKRLFHPMAVTAKK
jgi:tungstate transport system substrate-binding protein